MCSFLVAGCFICHKGDPKTKVKKSPAPKQEVISRYSFPEVASFAFDSSEIKGDNKLNELDKDIQAHPDAVILVEGHTDNIGSDEYNKELSYDRARAVAQAIAQKGYPNEVRLYGKGNTEPIASNDTEEGRAQNRRVDVVLVRELED